MLISKNTRKSLSYVMLPVMILYTILPSTTYGNETYTEAQANTSNSNAGKTNNYDEAKAAAEALNEAAAKSAKQSSKEKEENPASNSAASNYTMEIGAEVNTQTGQLDVTFNDVKLSGISEETSIDLGISNSGSESKIYGMPSGWKFSLDYIDIRNNTLYMNGSQNYTIDKTYVSKDGYSSGLRYCTSKAIKLEEEAGSLPYKKLTYRYKLSMKNGSSKYFDYYGKLLCQDDRFGNHIMYNYDKNDATPYNAILRSITDSFGQEIRIKSKYNVVTVTMPDERTVIYDVSDEREIKIKGVTDLTAYLSLDGKKRVKSIKYPTGGTVEYFYIDNALQYQVAGKAIDLPGVVKVVQDPHSEESKKAVTRYNYGAPGSFNFTGIGRYNYIPGDDILMKEGNNNYKYSTTATSERSADCGGNVISTQEFNFLHLPLKTKVTADGKCVGETTVNYLGEISEGNFPSSNRLLSNYNMPKKVTAKTFGKGNSREHIEETVYDDYNRPLSVINYNNGQPASKIETKYSEYYDLVESQSVYDYLDKEQGKDTPVTTITKTINTLDATTHKYIASSETFFANDKTRKKIATRTADNQGRITATGLRMTGGLVKNDSATSSSASTSYSLASDGYSLTVKDTDALGNAVSKIIDIRNGNLISATDAGGNTVSYIYENKGLIVRKIYLDGSWEKSDRTNPKKIVLSSSNGMTKTSTLDGFGRVVKEEVAYPGEAAITISETKYNELGKPSVITDEFGHSISYKYDYRGRVISSTDYLGNIKSVDYDDVAQTATKYFNGIMASVATLDDQGNVKDLSSFLSGNDMKQSAVYNGRNLEISAALDLGKDKSIVSSNSQYDFEGNLTSANIHTQDGTDGRSEYVLNLFGDVIQTTTSFNSVSPGVELGSGVKTSEIRTYNSLSQLTELRNQADQVIKYTYDANGNVKTMTDFAGKVFEYTYDNMGRMTRMSGDGGIYVMENEYYGKGGGSEGKIKKRHLRYDGKEDTIEYTYNNHGKLASVRYMDGKYMTAKYDEYDRVTSMTDFAGIKNEYTYNKDNQITKISNDFGSALYTYYNPREGSPLLGCAGDKIKEILYSNRVKIKYKYVTKDDEGNYIAPKLESIETFDSSNVLMSGSYYSYDKMGRVILQRQISAANPDNKNCNNIKHFTYNLSNQLINERVCDINDQEINSTDYTFDINENIISRVIKSGDVETYRNDYTYNELNQLTAIKESAAGGRDKFKSFDYDANGNMTSMMIDGVPVKKFTYNINNQLTKYRDYITGVIVFYEYNAERLRKCKYMEGTEDTDKEIRYYYSPNGEIINEAEGGKGRKMTSYLIAGSRILRAIHGIDGGTEEKAKVEWYIMNGKDVVSTIDDEEETTNVYNYNAYGEDTDLDAGGSVDPNKNTFDINSNPYKYSGYYLDEESGMYYLRARYYSPELMRFISRDTYDLSNRYAYGDGDPISQIDRNGHYTASQALGNVFTAIGLVACVASLFFTAGQSGWVIGLTAGSAITGIASSGMDIASMVPFPDQDDKIHNALQWSSFGSGLASMGLGLGAGAATIKELKAAKKVSAKPQVYTDVAAAAGNPNEATAARGTIHQRARPIKKNNPYDIAMENFRRNHDDVEHIFRQEALKLKRIEDEVAFNRLNPLDIEYSDTVDYTGTKLISQKSEQLLNDRANLENYAIQNRAQYERELEDNREWMQKYLDNINKRYLDPEKCRAFDPRTAE